jgi:hypothetical protein
VEPTSTRYYFGVPGTGTLGHQLAVTGVGQEWMEVDFVATVVGGQGQVSAYVHRIDRHGRYSDGVAYGTLHLAMHPASPTSTPTQVRLAMTVAVAEGV